MAPKRAKCQPNATAKVLPNGKIGLSLEKTRTTGLEPAINGSKQDGGYCYQSLRLRDGFFTYRRPNPLFTDRSKLRSMKSMAARARFAIRVFVLEQRAITDRVKNV
jgi:hypothetical protein